MPSSKSPVVIAIAAHPDDIEFAMAGTLLLLKDRGCVTHYLNLSSGSCGSQRFSAARTRAVRRGEAKRAAALLGAHWHPSLSEDLEIFYELKLLRRVAAIIREVQPSIVLTHAPHDYMEDHTNTCRLAVTASFARGMRNFKTIPARPPAAGDVALYHAMPHGLRDPMRRRVIPELFVDTSKVSVRKRDALAAHQSQKEWLDVSQDMDSYLNAMEDMAKELGRLSGRFTHAEGWRRHLEIGFCASGADPLRHLLGSQSWVNPDYESTLAAP